MTVVVHKRMLGLVFAACAALALALPAANAAKKTSSKKTTRKRYVPPSKLPKQSTYIKGKDGLRKTYQLTGISSKYVEYVEHLRIKKLPIQDIEGAEFITKFSPYQAKVLEKQGKYAEAAAYIIQSIAPALKYIKLPENNLMDPLFDAAYLYLDAAATHSDKKGHEYDLKAANKEYVKAYSVFKKITEADWYYGATLAQLNMAYCALKLKKRDIANKLFAKVDEPSLGDAAFGLYWLVDGMMKFEDKKFADALDSAIKAVVFDSKNIHVFPQALLLSAYCYEDTLDYYRARDVYFELARLFHDTPEGRIAFASIQFIRERKLTDVKEDVGIEKVFFNSVEDLNKTIDEYIPKAKEQDRLKEQRRLQLEERRKRKEAQMKRSSG